MSLLLSNDTRYVKLLLLLLKGGTFFCKKHTLKILDNDNTTIDICLKTHRDQNFDAFKKKVIDPKIWELLSPDLGQPKNIDIWDISAHAYVLLNLFDKRLTASETDAITKLRKKRNDLAHPDISSFDETKFISEWGKLTILLYQLSAGLTSNDKDYLDKLIDDVSAIQELDKANDELKPFEDTEDFVKEVLAEQHRSYEKRLEEACRRISELERKFESVQSGYDESCRRISELERKNESGQSEISARFTVRASEQTARDKGHHRLLEASKRCLESEYNKQDSDEVYTACKNMFTDMSKEGAHLKNVEEGSVLVTFSCSTWTSLKRAILYLTKTLYSQRLQELEKALSQSVGCCVKLNVNIVLESLLSTLDKAEHFASNKAVVLTMSCIGLKGVRSVCDNLVNGSSTNNVNNLSEALSRSVGQRIELHTSIDVDTLEVEISNLERRYEYHVTQERLKKSDEKAVGTVSISPLHSEDERVDMLTSYTPPVIEHKPYQRQVTQERLKKSDEKAVGTMSISPLHSEDERVDMLTSYTPPVIKHKPYQRLGKIMASNERSLMERLLRRHILSYGQKFLSYIKLNTEALLVITVDEDTRTRSVVNISDVIMNKSGEMNESKSDQLKMVLENSMKSAILQTMKLGNSINLLGIVTYQVDDGNYYVIKLDFEVNKDNRQGNGSSSSTSMINDKNEDIEDQNLEELGMQHEDDVSLHSSGADDVSGSDMAEQNDVNFDSESCFNEDYYKSLGLKVNENKDVTCLKCYKQCDDIKLLQVHNSVMHEGFTCLVCGNMLTNKHNLKRHIKVAHTPGKKECVFCKKKFRYDSDLKKHIRLTHGYKITSNLSQNPTLTSQTNIPESIEKQGTLFVASANTDNLIIMTSNKGDNNIADPSRRDGNEMKSHVKSMTKTLQDMTKTRVSADRQQMHSNIGVKSSIKHNVTKSHKQKLPKKLTSVPSNTEQKQQLAELSRVLSQSMHTGSSTELDIPKKIAHQSHKHPREVAPSAPKKKKIVQLQNNWFIAAGHYTNKKKKEVNQSASGIRNATQTHVSTMDEKVEDEITVCGTCGAQFTQREYLVKHWQKNPNHIT